MVVSPRDHEWGAGMPKNAVAYDGPIDCVGPISMLANEFGAWWEWWRTASSDRERVCHSDLLV